MPISCSVGKARYKTNIQYQYCLFLLFFFGCDAECAGSFLKKYLFIYLAALGPSCGSWDL